nr:cadherin domain-containing protein [Pirellulales bacterium]
MDRRRRHHRHQHADAPNVAPEFAQETYGFSLSENSSAGTAVGSVLATDGNALDTLTYSITGGNGTGAGAFAIDPSTGAITVNDVSQLNFEQSPQFTLTIQVTDDGFPSSLSDTATVTIDVTDLQEAPVVDSGGPYTLREGYEITLDGSGSFDPDAGDQITSYEWDLDADGDDVFTTTNPTLVLSYSQLGNPAQGHHFLSLSVRDQFGNLATDVHDLEVTLDVAPTITLSGQPTGNEGQTSTITFTAVDPDDTLTIDSITLTPSASLSISNKTYDPLTGQGSFEVTFPDGPSSASVSAHLVGGRKADDDVIDFTVDNVAPTVSLSLPPGPIGEGSSILVTPTVTELGNDEVELVWTLKRGATVISVSEARPMEPRSFDVDDDGDWTVEVVATDSDGAIGPTSSVTFTVDSSPPVVAISHGVAMGHAIAIGHDFALTLTSTDMGDDTLDAWFINWGDGSPIQEVPAAARVGTTGAWSTTTVVTHQYTSPGTYSISATGEDEDCDDADDRYATNSASVTVDTLPVVTVPSTPITGKLNRSILKSFFETGDVPTADQFTMDASVGDVMIDPSDPSAWIWSYAPTATGDLPVTITFTKPNGLSSSATFHVNVIDNAAPVFSPPSNVSVGENSINVLDLTAQVTDSDPLPGDAVSFTITGGADASSFVVNSHTSAFDLRFASPPNFEAPGDADGDNVYECIVTATDADGGQSTATILVSVTNVDDAPPVADVGGPFENIDASLPFVLDGTRSTDDGTIASYEWTL